MTLPVGSCWMRNDTLVCISEARVSEVRGNTYWINYLGGGESGWHDEREFIPIACPKDLLRAQVFLAKKEAGECEIRAKELRHNAFVYDAAITAIEQAESQLASVKG